MKLYLCRFLFLQFLALVVVFCLTRHSISNYLLVSAVALEGFNGFSPGLLSFCKDCYSLVWLLLNNNYHFSM